MNPNETPLYLNLAIGVTIGVTEAYANHPLWTLKTLIQQKKPLTLSWRVLYRGVASHAASSIPLDTIQTTASRIFYEHPYFKSIPNVRRRLLGGCFGGCFGALISSPAEMIMTRQLDKGISVQNACKDLWSEGRVKRFYAGIGSTLVRDSLFCCGFFSGVPILRDRFERQGFHTGLASVIGGIFSGIITAIISQPFDTIKTVIQSSPDNLSTLSVGRQILIKDGFRGLFSGLTLRVGRVASGILILGVLNDKLESLLLNQQYHN